MKEIAYLGYCLICGKSTLFTESEIPKTCKCGKEIVFADRLGLTEDKEEAKKNGLINSKSLK